MNLGYALLYFGGMYLVSVLMLLIVWVGIPWAHNLWKEWGFEHERQ